MKPKVVVLSAAGGAGKDTLLEMLMAQRLPDLVRIVTYTSRPRRAEETPGKEYRFLSREEFKKLIKKDALLEYNVFNNNYYGVPKAAVDAALQSGKSPILRIDVNGARAVRKLYPDQSLLIFITAPIETLRRRYIARGQSPEEADKRIEIAKNEEIPQQSWYDAVVENLDGQADRAVAQIVELIEAR